MGKDPEEDHSSWKIDPQTAWDAKSTSTSCSGIGSRVCINGSSWVSPRATKDPAWRPAMVAFKSAVATPASASSARTRVRAFAVKPSNSTVDASRPAAFMEPDSAAAWAVERRVTNALPESGKRSSNLVLALCSYCLRSPVVNDNKAGARAACDCVAIDKAATMLGGSTMSNTPASAPYEMPSCDQQTFKPGRFSLPFIC
mmetsp:Transcript_66961/g.178585  ORF Transcript_66961/g.178585 Transcript_66961/m.178585 type:complete len:200 (+) Transcript_66961:494-1093(+)